jgi:hypothetical protein
MSLSGIYEDSARKADDSRAHREAILEIGMAQCFFISFFSLTLLAFRLQIYYGLTQDHTFRET